VQALLGADEALVLFFDTPPQKAAPEETFIWVVAKTSMRWVRSSLAYGLLAREVNALRCGLDGEEWAASKKAQRCRAVLELTARHDPSQPLPFDLARAHGLYKALFGQVEDIIKGKHLLIVPSGALTRLPFQTLVTVQPANGDLKSAAWLIRDHAITVLPAVSSLKALRATGHPSAATEPLIGFGNPLLEGEGKDSPDAKLAGKKQSCRQMAWQRMAGLLSAHGALSPIETRGGLADVAFIKRLPPLPETADEICAVASDVGANVEEMRLGARATEREVKLSNGSQ
jgi:CHAT domain-containing protein